MKLDKLKLDELIDLKEEIEQKIQQMEIEKKLSDLVPLYYKCKDVESIYGEISVPYRIRSFWEYGWEPEMKVEVCLNGDYEEIDQYSCLMTHLTESDDYKKIEKINNEKDDLISSLKDEIDSMVGGRYYFEHLLNELKSIADEKRNH